MHIVRSLLLLIVLISAFTKAESNNDASSSSSFECGNPQQAMEISQDTATNSIFFDTIHTDLGVNDWNKRKPQQQLVPKTIHWHVYAIDNGETPKYSCYPEGLVEPKISGSTLQLAAKEDRLKDLGYHKGDKIQSSINLYIPLQQLRNILMDGVDETMEVVVTDTLLTNSTKTSSTFPSIRIRSTGVDSRLYVNAPYSPIYFAGSGVDTDATMVAGRNSTVELSGVDQRLRIKSEHLNGKVRLSGINTRVMIDGDYDSIDMSGIDCQVQVNGESGCNSVRNSGINNNCKVATSSDANVTVPQLECLSTTTVVEGCGVSVGAVVGVCIGLVVVIGLCVGGCIYCCRGRRRHRQEYQPQFQQGQLHKDVPQQVPESSMSSPAMAVYDPQKVVGHHPNVVEAEVLEIESTTRDPELANGIDAKVYA